MASRFLVFCVIYFFQEVNSQYYNIPAPNYLSYSYNHYSPTIPESPRFIPTYPNIPPRKSPQPKAPKRSSSAPVACPKCSPSTASAYFLSTPSEKVKATVLIKEKIKETSIPPPVYTCPLCNGFADVPPNSKISPPPPVGSPVLPGILDEVPTIVVPKIPEELTTKEPSTIILAKAPLHSDIYEKQARNKLPKNLNFDQELLEGFLTGLGIAL